MKTIPKQVLQGLKSVADETLEQGKEEIKKVVGLGKSEGSGQDLFPDIKGLTDEQKAILKKQDDEKRQKEMESLRGQMGRGRDVEGEIQQVRQLKEEEERKKEEEFLENLKKQRMVEQQERQRVAGMEAGTPSHKKKKSRGSAFARGKKPSQDEMSATGEFAGKKD